VQIIFKFLDIIDNFAKELFAQLDERLADWSDTQKIGDIFLRLVRLHIITPVITGATAHFSQIPFLKVYGEYGKNYDTAMQLIHSLATSNTEFREFLNACRANPVSKKRDIQSFLIAPSTQYY
jgi:hypothetical protein